MDFLTNALKPAKVIEAVRKYKPRHLYISLDGNKETYKVMRGCDGHDRVLEVARALKGELPISFMFCLPLLLPFDEIPADVADCHGRVNSREFCLNLQS